jgi:acylphosphatase
MAKVAYRVRVYGRVQGVFFRASMKEVAEDLGVDGWVRNMPDGSVEALVSGEEEKVEKILEWCRRGPELARVDKVEITPADPPTEKGFHIKYPQSDRVCFLPGPVGLEPTASGSEGRRAVHSTQRAPMFWGLPVIYCCGYRSPAKSGTKTMATVFRTLMTVFRDGPAVSL